MAIPSQILQAVEDPRRGNRFTYPIAYLLLGAFCALLAGYNDYVAFEHLARHYAQDFQALYARLTGRKLPSYTPSHDTFSLAFGMLAPGQCRDAFKQWLKALFALVDQHIGIDGKAMRWVKKLAPEARAPRGLGLLPGHPCGLGSGLYLREGPWNHGDT